MIIKSFKLFESLDEYKYLLEGMWGYPNWLFVHRDDAVRIFSLSSDRPGVIKKMERNPKIYPEIFNVNNLNKFNNIYNKRLAKKMYIPRTIQR